MHQLSLRYDFERKRRLDTLESTVQAGMFKLWQNQVLVNSLKKAAEHIAVHTQATLRVHKYVHITLIYMTFSSSNHLCNINC